MSWKVDDDDEWYANGLIHHILLFQLNKLLYDCDMLLSYFIKWKVKSYCDMCFTHILLIWLCSSYFWLFHIFCIPFYVVLSLFTFKYYFWWFMEIHFIVLVHMYLQSVYFYINFMSFHGYMQKSKFIYDEINVKFKSSHQHMRMRCNCRAMSSSMIDAVNSNNMLIGIDLIHVIYCIKIIILNIIHTRNDVNRSHSHHKCMKLCFIRNFHTKVIIEREWAKPTKPKLNSSYRYRMEIQYL